MKRIESTPRKDGFRKFLEVRKKYYSQKSIGESMRVKKIYNTPYHFIKDLNLISLGINKSLKIFNKIQLELLEDKKILNNLKKNSFENENLEKEFREKEINLQNKLNSIIIYYKYLKNQRKSLWFQSKKNKIKKDFILIKIEQILNNIRIYGGENLLKSLENSENIEIIINTDYNNINTNKNKNHKLNLLKIIENIIIFLIKNNNEFKKNEKEKYHEIERNIRYLSHLNNSRKIIEREKIKKQIKLIQIMEKSNNLLFLPNKNNYYVNSKSIKNDLREKNIINKENEKKALKTILGIDFEY